jgi:hypothetical protein
MALCCIGGICIPYSALAPLIVLGMRWVIEKLAALGLLPKSSQTWLLTTFQIQPKANTENTDCCSTAEKTTKGVIASCDAVPGSVRAVRNAEEWEGLLQSNETVVAKFTAAWCALQGHSALVRITGVR